MLRLQEAGFLYRHAAQSFYVVVAMRPWLVLLLSAARAVWGIFEVDFSEAQGLEAYVVTRNTRLGSDPGRPFRFVIDFGFDAVSALDGTNELHSKYWHPTPPRDLVATPTTVLNVTFEPSSLGYSTIAFYELAKLRKSGAYVCRDEIGIGEVPPHCDLETTFLGSCNADGCFFDVAAPDKTETKLLLLPSFPPHKCTVNVTFLGYKDDICAYPATLPGGIEGFVAGINGESRHAYWTDGTYAELYLHPRREDPVERAGICVIATIALVAWCDYTSTLTSAVVASSPVPAIFGTPAAASSSSISHVLMADVIGMIAFSISASAWRRGITVVHESVYDTLSEATAYALIVAQSAYLWYATALAWIILVGKRHIKRFEHVGKSPAGTALLVRTTFETALLFSIHSQLPREKLGLYVETIGFAFGLVAIVVTARDATLAITKVKDATITASYAFVVLIAVPYATFVMILPSVVQSTAVFNYRNASVIFAMTLGGQAAAVGILGAKRRTAEFEAAVALKKRSAKK